MGKLSVLEQRFVIRSVAGFMRPTEIADTVLEKFGKRISPAAVLHYDPTTRQGQQLSARLRAEFARERRRFHKHIDDIPLNHVAFRLQELQNVIDSRPRSPMVALRALAMARAECEMAATAAVRPSRTSNRSRPPA